MWSGDALLADLEHVLNCLGCNHAEPEQDLQDYIIIERVYPEWVSEAGGVWRCGLAESQDVDDFRFIQRLAKVAKPKVTAPKAAKSMDLQQLGRWRRPSAPAGMEPQT